MGRMGSSADWDDARDGNRSRSGRGASSSGRGGRNGGPNSQQVAAALREAQQLQQDGQLEDAIQVCEELLDSGVDRADVHYFLGWLYQEADRWEDAAERFELLLNDPDYALSCYYALGQCARAQGNIEDAARYFDEAVDRVNLDALTHDESDQLIQLCQEAAEAHREMNDLEGAETVYTALLGFLRSQGWQDQVAEIERLMRETLGTAPPQPRRRKADPSRPIGGNMPQRGGRARGGAGSSGRNQPPPAARDDDERALDEAAGAISEPPQATPNPAISGSHNSAQMPAAPSPELGGFGAPDGFGGGIGSTPGMGGLGVSLPGAAGMGGMLGAGPLMDGAFPGVGIGGVPPMQAGGMNWAGGMAPAGQGDQLSHLINHLGGAGMVRTGMNSLPEPLRSQVAQAVRNIENYVAHGLLTAAIEECLRVLEIAPQYLDVHLMLGEIYVRQGKVDQAIGKYAILIDTYMVNGRIDDAISTYRRILQLEPNNLNYRVKLIELLNRQGRLDEVLAERMTTADTYLRLGYADRAIQEFEQALLASPNNLPVRLNYALALMKAGRAQQAIGEYQRVLQVDPNNLHALAQWQIALASGVSGSAASSMPGAASRAQGFEVLGRLLRSLRLENLRSYDEIVREYMQALEGSPINPDLRYALGQIHLAANRQQEALTSFQQIASAPGLEVLARYGAGQACLLSGDPASAAMAVRELEAASSAVRQSPPDPALWTARPRLDGEELLAPEMEVSMLLARAYQMSGQVAPSQSFGGLAQPLAHSGEVYHALAEIQARQSDPAAVLQEYAQLVRQYRTNRQVENAVAVLKEMVRVAPDDPAVRTELADIHVSRGLLDEGLMELRQLADIHTRRGQLKDAAAVYQHMAEISWGMENREEGLNQLKQAMQYATEDMTLRQQYVQYCLEVGRMPEAKEQQTIIARYHFASRQTKEAVAALQQLIGMDPHSYEAYDLLGQTYYSVGEYEQAARVYRNLAKVDPNSPMARARLAELHAVRQMR